MIVGPLYDKIASLDMLRRGWEKVYDNRGAAGGDGLTVERFALVAEAQIERLSQQLVKGTYRPGPARRCTIPKRSGGVRPLDIPCVTDRVVQTSATLVLDPILDPEMEASSFAYRRGRSVAQAVARIAALRRQGYDHVVDGDIRTYFEAIPHERLIARLEKSVNDNAVIDLVWLWLETYSLTGRGIPQGAPISPLLANIYLDTVDERIHASGVRLVRFADDFVLMCRSPTQAQRGLADMAGLLAEEGLEIHPEKTRIVDFTQGFRFLGHLFVRQMVLKEVDIDETPVEADVVAALDTPPRADDEESDEDDDPAGRARVLYPVYIVEPGKRLEARGTQLRVVDPLSRIVPLPPEPIHRIELGPNTDATLDALDLAAAHDIDVYRVDGHGSVLGRWTPAGQPRARLHLAQAEAVLDPARRLALARVLVGARIHNMRAVLRRMNRSRRDAEVAAAAAKISRIIRKVSFAPDVAAAMGIEGEAAAVYWPAYGRGLPEEYRLARRRRRPAPDCANLVLNVLANMLSRDVVAMIERVGLHPGFSTLHAPRDGEPSLSFDLVEEFRGPLCEACALALFNRRAIGKDHLRAEDGHVSLTRDGWRAIIRGYETWVARPVRSPRNGRQVLWRQLILEQAHSYAAACLEGSAYDAYRMDY